jgi:hypothetical protein
MSYRYEEDYEYYGEEQPPGGRRRWLIALTVVIWLLVIGCLVIRFVVQPALTDFVNRRIARTINPQLPSNIDPIGGLRDSLSRIPFGTIPPGRYEVPEAQANAYLAAFRSQLGGFEESRVRFVPGQVQADLTLRGLTSTARTEVTTTPDGRIQAVNPRLDPPLGVVLSIESLVRVLEDRINNELSAQGRRVTSVEIQQGVAVVTIE